jgi:tetratricopeptide (TPR) repeat protein
LDDFRGAEADFDRCIERNPFVAYAYQYRGIARQSQKNYEAAIVDYRKNLEFRPEDKQSRLNMSIAFAQEKNYDRALACLDSLLSLHPRLTQAYLTRAAVYTEHGDTAAAYQDYDKAIELEDYSAPAYAQRALLALQQDKYQAALTDFDRAIRLDDRQAAYYINRGLVRYNLNDLRGAMADYDKVVAMDAHNPIARFNRGLLRAQVGDVYGALTDFGDVIDRESDNYMAIYNRALLNEEAREYRASVSDLDAVLAEYPNFVPGYYFRSEVKRKMNDAKGADKDYWYAYNLEQKLRKERDEGKIVTGREVYDSQASAEAAQNTREQSDKDIAKFNRLVVYDKETERQSKYNDDIRGRVQDQQAQVEPEPSFVITYYENVDALERATAHIDRRVSDYNQRHLLEMALRMVNHEAPLTDEQAAAHFQSIDRYSLAIMQDSTDATAYFGRALDFMVVQDFPEAISDYTRVIALDPQFIPAIFNRAVVRYKQMKVEQSEKTTENRHFEYELILYDYETIIRLHPDFVYAWYNRGNLRYEREDYRLAINDYSEAIRRNPDFAEAYFNRGLAHLALGETATGIGDLSKAGELGIVGAYSLIKKMTTE